MTQEQEKPRVLFLCTGNACRSQMAEAWAHVLKSDRMDVYSAGLQPAGLVSSRTLAVMADQGVDMSSHYSKGLDAWAGLTFDYVVVLCERAYQYCPPFPETTRVICHPFPDPTRILGPLEQVKGAFEKVRDMIKAYVETLPEALAAAGPDSKP